MRAGRGAAARADADAVPLREADEVRDDQEVVGEAHLADRLELEAEPLLQLGRRAAVAPLDEPLLAELDEVLERVAAVGHRELGQQDPAELDLDGAALGDLERAPQRLLVAGEVERHLGGGLEEELVRLEAPVVRVLSESPDWMQSSASWEAASSASQVVDVAGGDERQAAPRRRGPHELRVDARLHVEARVLQLDVGRVAAEDLREPVEVGLARPGPCSPRAPCRRGPRGSRRARSGPSRAARAAPSRRAACSSSPRGSRASESLIRLP